MLNWRRSWQHDSAEAGSKADPHGGHDGSLNRRLCWRDDIRSAASHCRRPPSAAGYRGQEPDLDPRVAQKLLELIAGPWLGPASSRVNLGG